jgi:hypothetical protein
MPGHPQENTIVHFDIMILLTGLAFGLLWRLRGGAFATLTGLNVGTQATRIASAVLMAGFLYLLTRHWIVLGFAPCLFVGWILGGWGPFQGMGLEADPGFVPEKSWLRWLPEQLGLKPGTVFHDLVGMAEAGVIAMAPSGLFVAYLTHWTGLYWLLVVFAGIGFAPCYLAARLLPFPTIPKFAQGQAWGEVLTGVLVGAALGYSLLHL